MNVNNDEELYRKVVLLGHALNRADMFIEPTDNRLPQGLEEPMNGIIDPTIPTVTPRNYFIHNASSCIANGTRPAIKIVETGSMIAVPLNWSSSPDFRLIDILRQMGISAEPTHWDSDYESFYIALRKYPYIKRCINNQQWKKLVQYIKKAF